MSPWLCDLNGTEEESWLACYFLLVSFFVGVVVVFFNLYCVARCLHKEKLQIDFI